MLALGKAEITSKRVKETIDIWETITDMSIHVSIGWIKAHAGIEGNELADEEAKMGALSISVWSDTLKPWKKPYIKSNKES